MLIKQANQKDSDICHYCYFLEKGSNFQPHVCSRCHDLLMMSMNLSEIAILNTESANYCCIISRISNSKSFYLMQNIDLTKESRTL